MKKAAAFIISAILALLLLVDPDIAVDAAKNSIILCGHTVLPILFPYIALTKFLIRSGCFDKPPHILKTATEKLFHLPEACAIPLLIGAVGGFPTGAQTAAELYCSKKITKAEAEHLLLFCSNAGPAFIFGIIGKQIFGSISLSAVLLAVHLFSAILIGIIFRPKEKMCGRKPEETISDPDILPTISEAVSQAGSSALTISGFIIFFQIVSCYFINLIPTAWASSPVTRVLLAGVELAGGIQQLNDLSVHNLFILLSVLLGWNGICVHCQVLSVIRQNHLSHKSYFIGKILHPVFSGVLSCIICPIIFHHYPSIPLTVALTVLLIYLTAAIAKTSYGKVRPHRI